MRKVPMELRKALYELADKDEQEKTEELLKSAFPEKLNKQK